MIGHQLLKKKHPYHGIKRRLLYLLFALLNGGIIVYLQSLAFGSITEHLLGKNVVFNPLGPASFAAGTVLAIPLTHFLKCNRNKSMARFMLTSALAGATYGILTVYTTEVLIVSVSLTQSILVWHSFLTILGQLLYLWMFMYMNMTGVAILIIIEHAPIIVTWGILIGIANGLILRTLLPHDRTGRS